MVTLMMGSIPFAAGAATIRLKALPAAVRVGLEGTVGGTDTVEISAARGEVESFQVVVTSSDGNLRGISVQMSPLKGPAGASIAAQNVRLYREIFIPVRYSSAQATEPPGLLADPLVPFVNPYTDERVPEPRWRDNKREGARFGAVGFDLWQDRHQPLWVDVQVPKNTAPGVYEGTLSVRAPSYHPDYAKVSSDNPPSWQIDFPVLSYRIAPWLNRRYGVTGLLYWTTVCWNSPPRNPWDDPGFRVNYNGEGLLFYPGEDAGIDGPIASIRLKNLRDGMEDYEYFVLLEKAKGKEIVDEIVRTAVPTWGTWDQNPYHLLALRERLAREILARE